MIDELRIKCPSCGVVLDVRNSRHEAVKKIVCPNCKKQLAVDFQEQAAPKPASLGRLYYGQMRIDLHEGINQIPIPDCEHLELNVVRIADGGCKCMARPLSVGHPVLLNGQQLEQDDQVVLALGDELKTGNTLLVFGQPQATLNVSVPPKPSRPSHPSRRNHLSSKLIAGMAIIAALAFVIILWPPKSDTELPPDKTEGVIETTDSTDGAEKKADKVEEDTKHKSKESKKAAEEEKSVETMSPYDLELLAGKGDIAAMCELGKRKVGGDSASVVLGINYLKRAADRGSSEAAQSLKNTIRALEQKAANGSTTAENILKEQQLR